MELNVEEERVTDVHGRKEELNMASFSTYLHYRWLIRIIERELYLG